MSADWTWPPPKRATRRAQACWPVHCMVNVMLARFKTVGPKMKIFLGLWLVVELLSIPAAAQIIRYASISDDRMFVAEEAEPSEPGKARFLVTHTVPFDVAVSGVTGNVIVMVENAKPGPSTAFETAQCVTVESDQLRTVLTRTIEPSATDSSPFRTSVVTLFFDEVAQPDIHLEPKIFAPHSQPCENKPL